MLFRIFKGIQPFSTSVTKLPNIWQVHPDTYQQLSNALIFAHSIKMIGVLIQENITQITDHQIAFGLKRIIEMDLDVDQHFYDKIVPVLKDLVPLFTREHAITLAQVIGVCGKLNVHDKKLWEVLEKKFIEEKIYRYLILLINDMFHQKILLKQLWNFKIVNKDLHFYIKHWKDKQLDISIYSFLNNRLALEQHQAKLLIEAFEKKKVPTKLQQIEQQDQKQIA